ncbi:MAG: hypothetical protein ACE147_15320 [Candidatus Methylomirabilales bacterium]
MYGNRTQATSSGRRPATSGGRPAVFLLGFVLLWIWSSPGEPADPHTKEAIRQMEEGLHAVRPAPPPPWVYPAPWWAQYPAACPPGYACPPVAPQPYWPATPYPMPAPQAGSVYPAAVNPAGRLLILVNPVDAEVYVDGVRLQQREDLSYEVGLLAGPHQLEVRKDGYKAFSKRLDILPGGGMYVPIALEK